MRSETPICSTYVVSKAQEFPKLTTLLRSNIDEQDPKEEPEDDKTKLWKVEQDVKDEQQYMKPEL
jgi:hypothetical protein